mgnify:CR=1 FL=1
MVPLIVIMHPRHGLEPQDKRTASPGVSLYTVTQEFAKRDAWANTVVPDAEGKIAWGRPDIGGDPIVVFAARSRRRF